MTQPAEVVHFMTTASDVECGAQMRDNLPQHRYGWDMGTCSVNKSEVTCLACLHAEQLNHTCPFGWGDQTPCHCIVKDTYVVLRDKPTIFALVARVGIVKGVTMVNVIFPGWETMHVLAYTDVKHITNSEAMEITRQRQNDDRRSADEADRQGDIEVDRAERFLEENPLDEEVGR